MQKYFSLTLRLWQLLKPFHKDFYIQLSSIIVQQVIQIGITYVFAKTIDALINKNIPLLTWIIILYPILNIIKNRIGYYTDLHSIRRMDNAIQQHLEEFSFKRIFKLNVSQYREDHSAIKLQVINRGENAVESIVSTLVLTFLPALTQVILALIAISFYSLSVAAWCLVTLIITIIWSNHFSNFHRPLVKENMDNWDKQRKVRTEAFQHLSLIKLISGEEHYLSKYLKNRLSMLTFNIKVFSYSSRHVFNRGLFLIISRTGTFIIVIELYLKSLITVGAVYALWSWINDIYGTIQSIVQTLRQVPLRFVELEKYLDIIDKEASFEEEGEHRFKEGSIEFKNLIFKYPLGDQPVLHNVSFTIEQGKTTAFVGHSGSGKSTIVNLLLRVYDWSDGDITVGDTSIRNMSARSLRKHIGYVEQHVDLFDDTIQENILIGLDKGKEKEHDLESVARLARIDQFYHRLGEKKFDTVIGERGIKLSGGERQRIGIARAIIKDPEILIFDEATSSLDTENERYVMDAIRDVSKGKTTIIIAHRLSTVRDADKIIVMDKGQVVGEGGHSELMQSNSVYQNLVAHQV